MYLIALATLLPIYAIIMFFEENIHKEAFYGAFKKYHQEFWSK